MRPIKLEIEGLHSFRNTQTIDFEFIARNGIFGIFGDTGSGKSTILDAIILSLYGKISRSKTNSEFINSKSSQARVRLVFSYKSGSRQKKYDVERVFKRNKKKPNEVEQFAEISEVTALGKKQVAEGAFKVDNFIKDLLGMGENEFSKCIALPQGEFAGFLKAKPSDRINIIGNIFDLNQYGQQLYDKASKHYDTVSSETNKLAGRLEALEKTDADDIKNLEDELAERRQELKLDDLKLSKMQERRVLLETNISLEKRFKELEERLSSYLKEQKTIDKDKELISKSLSFDKIKDKSDRRDEVVRMIESEEKKLAESKAEFETKNAEYQSVKKVYDDNLDETEREIEEGIEKYNYIKSLKDNKTNSEKLIIDKSNLETQLSKLSINQTELEQAIEEFESEIAKIAGEISSRQKIVEDNRESVELYEELSQIKYVSKQIEVIDDFSSTLGQLIDGKNREGKQARDDVFALYKKEKDLKKDINKTTESIDAFLKTESKNSYEKLRVAEKKLFLMQNADSKIKFLKAFIAGLLLENDEHVDNIKKLNKQVEDTEKSIKKHEDNCTKIEQEIQAEQESREGYLGQNVLSVMLEHTEIGDECPVCRGNIIQKQVSPKTDLSVFDNNIINLKNKLKTAEQEKAKVIFLMSSLQTRIEDEKNTIKINQTKAKKIEEDIEKELIKFVDINKQSETRFASLLELTKSTVGKIEKLIIAENQIKEKIQKVANDRVELGAKTLIYSEVSQELSEVYELFQSIRAEKQLHILDYTGKDKDLHQSMNELVVFTKQTQAAKKDIELLSEQRRETQDKLAKTQILLAGKKSEKDRVQEKIKELEVQIEQLLDPIKKETYSDLDEHIQKFKERLDAKREKLKQDKLTLERLASETKELEHNMKLFATLIDNYNTEAYNIDKSLINTMNELGVKFSKELKKFELTDEQRAEIEEKIKRFESEYKLAQTEHKQLQEKLTDEKFDEVEYTALEQKINNITTNQNQRRENIGNLAQKLETKKDIIKKSESLTKELVELSKKQTTAKELRDLLRGRALMEYVAEEYIDDITKIASQKLMMLKNGEYSLVSENKEFFVIDNLDDGFKRSVGTLSGGETFIVSLALALAISESIIQNSQKSMDFFFLDEGFGTLDPNLREAIISSIYRLESQNLTIGLISHVSELKNTIKSKILVKKRSDNTGSVIEYDYIL